jgi:glutathione-specific gamma-glutamylcyclotransferase
MLNNIYIPVLVNVHVKNGQIVKALSFAANRRHESYLSMTEDQLLARLSLCVGDRGANKDYALNTWRALKQHGVRDQRLDKIASKLIHSDNCVE